MTNDVTRKATYTFITLLHTSLKCIHRVLQPTCVRHRKSNFCGKNSPSNRKFPCPSSFAYYHNKNRWNLLWAFLSSKTGNLTPPNGSLHSLMEEDESTTLCHDNEDLDLDLLDFLIMRMGPLKHRLKTPILCHIAICYSIWPARISGIRSKLSVVFNIYISQLLKVCLSLFFLPYAT